MIAVELLHTALLLQTRLLYAGVPLGMGEPLNARCSRAPVSAASDEGIAEKIATIANFS